MKQLIIGGARSGKSAEAESRVHELVASQNLKPFYIATGQAFDKEMQQRIHHHQIQRQGHKQHDKEWHLIEEPLHLAATLAQHDNIAHCILVDCLSLWLSNCLHQKCWQEEKSALLSLLPSMHSHIIFVSNEVGSGIVPLGELNRKFVDESGRLHQELAQVCDRVSQVLAGLNMDFKKP